MKSHTWQFDRHGDPADVMHWREQELPEPGPGQALVRIRSVGLNNSDMNYVSGQYFPPEEFPTCQGQEAVGDVLALGSELQGKPLRDDEIKVGSRIAFLPMLVDTQSMGVFRDVGLYSQSALVPVPEGFSDAEGAAYWEGIITMVGALDMAGAGPDSVEGKTLLVTAGASGMGVIALKLARAWGMRTIATTRNTRKAKGLEDICDAVVVSETPEKIVEGVHAVTDGRGADVILDPVGDDYFPALIECAASSGSIVSYESMTGSSASLPILQMMLKDLSIHGFTVHRTMNNPELLDRLIAIGLEYADVARPIIAGHYRMSDAPEALVELRKARHLGKLILEA